VREPGCGVIAPVIIPSPDGRRVSWVDFRDYVGVFVGPVKSVVGDEGRPWDLPDLHFDRERYVAEIERASQDGSWETDRRRTARLLYEHLEPLELVLPPDLGLAWASPAWSADGVVLMFQRLIRAPQFEVRQQMLRLTSTLDDPDQAAQNMVQRLLSISPDDWADSFGWHPDWSWLPPNGLVTMKRSAPGVGAGSLEPPGWARADTMRYPAPAMVGLVRAGTHRLLPHRNGCSLPIYALPA
jgi:hypothetical protein